MRRLILMRHAHACAASAALPDTLRPLDARGRLEAAEAAQRLHAHGLIPGMIVTSPAVRARETALVVASGLHLAATRVHRDPALYMSDGTALLAAIRRCPPQIGCLLLAGHNPGLSELAQQFDAFLKQSLPTAGICCVSLPDDGWERLVARPVNCRILTSPAG